LRALVREVLRVDLAVDFELPDERDPLLRARGRVRVDEAGTQRP
jgi:hypothetical protein